MDTNNLTVTSKIIYARYQRHLAQTERNISKHVLNKLLRINVQVGQSIYDYEQCAGLCVFACSVFFRAPRVTWNV